MTGMRHFQAADVRSSVFSLAHRQFSVLRSSFCRSGDYSKTSRPEFRFAAVELRARMAALLIKLKSRQCLHKVLETLGEPGYASGTKRWCKPK